uniref:hypothetical protein n=1 Tax=Bartonella sp. TT110JLCBS TaxID=3243578 RepID=UPI0035CFB632
MGIDQFSEWISFSTPQNNAYYNSYHPNERGYQNILWNNDRQHWEEPQEQFQKDETLAKDASSLENALASFIEASDVSCRRMEATRKIQETSYNNLEHQLGWILDTLSKEQKLVEQTTPIPWKDDVVATDVEEMRPSEHEVVEVEEMQEDPCSQSEDCLKGQYACEGEIIQEETSTMYCLQDKEEDEESPKVTDQAQLFKIDHLIKSKREASGLGDDVHGAFKPSKYPPMVSLN